MQRKLSEILELTLGDVASMLRDGIIGIETARDYVERWNETSFRFTRAEVIGRSIVQRERD